MGQIRGITHKVFYAHNPMPDLTEDSLYERARVDLPHRPDAKVFDWLWKYSAQDETEYLWVRTGDFAPLRQSEAEEWLREHKDLGGVLVEDPTSGTEVQAKKIDGLQRAMRLWRERGKVRIQEFRKSRGLTAEETEERRSDLWAYHLNEAKADAIEEELKKIRTVRKPAAPKAAVAKES